MPKTFAHPDAVMQRAIELAKLGEGSVEPNPMVGAVIVDDALTLLGEGYHQKFGGPHAEVHAIAQAGGKAVGGTMFVTLEPCCHQGKTPPCTDAVIAAGIRNVVVGLQDPAKQVDGGGIARLREAGISVEVGLLETKICRLNAPFIKLVTTGMPYVHAKWAMTLDGKIASRTGHSQWISNQGSREVVHRLRGRMDAILVGATTAFVDDPLLTARPPGSRTALRIVVDKQAELSTNSQLVKTAGEAPVIVVAAETAMDENISRLEKAGVEVLRLSTETVSGEQPQSNHFQLKQLLEELGRRNVTNLLIEGGGEMLGSFFDQKLIDEVHVFIAPKLVGGKEAKSPLAGLGLEQIPEAAQISNPTAELIDGDIYIHGPATL